MNTNNTQRLLTLLKQTKSLLVKQDRKDLIASIERSESYLIKREKVVLVCGEFKRGKSSLIGGLLERDDICPVDADIATAVVSVISYGQSPKAIRHYGEIGSDQHEEVPFDQIQKYAKGKAGVTTDTWLMEIQVPCKFLKDGIVLVDTPGVGGLDSRHGFLTSYFMPRADVVVFVADAGIPLSDSELSFLKDKVVPANTQEVVALNKADKLKRPEKQVRDIEMKIGDILDNAYRSVGIIPVSSKLKLDYLENGAEEDLQESNFSLLEDCIAIAIEQHNQSLILLSLQEGAKALTDVRSPLQVQLDYLGQEIDNESLADLKKRFAEKKEHVQNLLEPRSAWRTQAADALRALREEVMEIIRIENINISAQKHLRALMKEKVVGHDPNSVMNRVAQSLEAVAEQADKRIVTCVSQIHSDLKNQRVLEHIDDSTSLCRFQIEIAKGLSIHHPSPGRRVLTYGRNVIAGGFLNQLVVPTVAALTNPLFGVIAGLYVVYESGRIAHEQLSEEQIRNILEEIKPEIDKAFVALNSHIADRLKSADDYLKKSFDEELQRAKTRYEEIAKALESVIKRNAEQRKELDRLVKTKLEPIDQLLKYFERLSQSLAANANVGQGTPYAPVQAGNSTAPVAVEA